MVHEIYHACAFSSTGYGSGSFISRVVNNNTYNGTRVQSCANRTNILTDDAQVHWSQNDGYFGPTDIQTPIIDAEFTWSKCTSEAVLESRSTWTSIACDTSLDCPPGDKCYTFGSNLGGFCYSGSLPQTGAPVQHPPQFPAFSAFVFFGCVFLNIFKTCLHVQKV